MDEARKLLPQKIEYIDNLYDIFNGADAVVLLTEWNEYRGLDLDRIKRAMRNNVFVDLRNVYNPKQMHERGFEYICVGRQKH
jgi:UDPglucose 6-dehydrogenase